MDYYGRPTERYASPPRRRRSISEKAKDAIGHYAAESKRPHHDHGQHHERGRPRRYDDGLCDDDDDDSPSDSRSDGYGADEERRRRRRQQRRRPSRSRHDEREPRRAPARRPASDAGLNWKQATGAAVGAALIEGWHARHTTDRNTRVATAAAGAAAIDLAIGQEGDRKNKRHALESTLGGLMIDRVVNGSSKR